MEATNFEEFSASMEKQLAASLGLSYEDVCGQLLEGEKLRFMDLARRYFQNKGLEPADDFDASVERLEAYLAEPVARPEVSRRSTADP